MSDTSRLLVLVRHGKAERGEEGGDHDRGLTARGRTDAAATGRRIAEVLAGRPVDLAWVSSAARAHQTWEQLADSLPAVGRVVVERVVYEAGGRDVLDRVQDDMAAGLAVMIVVGHNPTMEQVALAVVGELHSMRPGTAAVIELDAGDVLPPRGRLIELISPRG